MVERITFRITEDDLPKACGEPTPDGPCFIPRPHEGPHRSQREVLAGP